MNEPRERLLDIRSELEWLAGPGRLRRLAFLSIEKLLGFRRLNRILRECDRRSSDPAQFISCLVESFGFDVEVTGPGREEVPAAGPVIVASNHPFGAADAVVVGDWALRHRPETRCLANEFIYSILPIRPVLIAVDVFDGNPDAKRRNLRSLRDAGRHLGDGGQLVIFPGGEVASWSWRVQAVTEPEWPPLAGSLVQRYQATVVPVFLPGRNSALFHLLGTIHPFLRSTWLIRELLRRQNSTIELRVGRPIEADRSKTPREIIAEIRAAVFSLE